MFCMTLSVRNVTYAWYVIVMNVQLECSFQLEELFWGQMLVTKLKE